MSGFLQGVIPFLSSDRADVRIQGLKVICAEISQPVALSQCSDEDILGAVDAIIKVLSRGSSLKSAAAELALTALINIFAEKSALIASEKEYDIIERLYTSVSKMLSKEKHINLSLILLSNLTTVDDSAQIESFLSVKASEYTSATEEEGKDKGTAKAATLAEAIAKCFLRHNPQCDEPDLEEEKASGNSMASSSSSSSVETSWEDIDPWQHGGSILVNITRSEKGRDLVMDRSRGYIPLIASQIRSRNIVRRRAAVAVIKNCLFDTSHHWWLVVEAKIISPLVHPILVSSTLNDFDRDGMDPLLWMQVLGPNRKFDPDREVIRLVLESITLLCQRRVIREQLRIMKVYPLVRNLDYSLEDEELSAMIYEIVNFLMRDESNEKEDVSEEIGSVIEEAEKGSVIGTVIADNAGT